MRTRQRAVAVGATAMMIGSICPWARIFGLVSASGLEIKWGWGTLAAGVLLVTIEAAPGWLRRHFAWLYRYQRIATALLASAAIVLAGYIVVGINVGYDGLASAGWGLYLTLVAAIAVLWGAIGRTA